MKWNYLLTGMALTGLVATSAIHLPSSSLSIAPAIASEATTTTDATGLSVQQKIDQVTQNKGRFGSGDQLRRFFFGDLEPIAVQPGGAGMVVNLYNKTNDVTFAYCATYDVVVAVKSGRVERFEDNEVK
ncbi:MAG: hypothetical protein MUF49_07485 [Oculatellaceae cyanobacterium Prado106]|nr:hypothetical protein [Oculatellaceae cyanobacterium Prado106]